MIHRSISGYELFSAGGPENFSLQGNHLERRCLALSVRHRWSLSQGWKSGEIGGAEGGRDEEVGTGARRWGSTGCRIGWVNTHLAPTRGSDVCGGRKEAETGECSLEWAAGFVAPGR